MENGHKPGRTTLLPGYQCTQPPAAHAECALVWSLVSPPPLFFLPPHNPSKQPLPCEPLSQTFERIKSKTQTSTFFITNSAWKKKMSRFPACWRDTDLNLSPFPQHQSKGRGVSGWVFWQRQAPQFHHRRWRYQMSLRESKFYEFMFPDLTKLHLPNFH